MARMSSLSLGPFAAGASSTGYTSSQLPRCYCLVASMRPRRPRSSRLPTTFRARVGRYWSTRATCPLSRSPSATSPWLERSSRNTTSRLLGGRVEIVAAHDLGAVRHGSDRLGVVYLGEFVEMG